MRTLSILFLLVVFMTSIASAEMLTTANPIGQGRWAVEGFGIQDMNLVNISDATLTTYGGYVGYGITDQLDAYLNVGASSSSGITGTEITGTGYGLSVKYALLREGEAMPVSVAVAGQYKSVSITTKIPAWSIDTTDPGSQIAIGVGCSKIIIPFIPYAGIAYRADSSDSTEQSTQLDITIGTAIAWSEQGAVLIEYTSQAMTPKAVDPSTGLVPDAYTSGQIALAVGYKI